MIRRNLMKLSASATLASVMALAGLPAAAADITMNVGFGAPEASIYGRFGAHFEKFAEEYTGGSVDVKLRCCTRSRPKTKRSSRCNWERLTGSSSRQTTSRRIGH